MLSAFRSALKTFAVSPQTFLHLPPLPPSASSACTHVHVLDSSFNPPTLAHLSLALSSLSSLSAHPHPTPTNPSNTRLLLLLATQNVDKPTSPAPFEDRLAMMALLSRSPAISVPVDIALTKHARFLDKARDLADAYPGAEQVYLIGYDTLIRLLDGKYYPTGMGELAKFFKRNQVVCTMREGAWGEQGQREFLESVKRGEREKEGCRREWAQRITLVEGREEGRGVSSTKVREAVKSGDVNALERLLTKEVAEYVRERGLYTDV
ncbi:cytidylyltransferase family protein [Tricharina praecox]|uniref:cytidylyltransferase family protein n=1 Tax=Tricharina praecox TaxID=43433 RepID=UPI00221EB94C|nr:cytidylyltransferase family protein [Tricharina praecox]KAI5845413.1 cytidylyltransferase family protein [Tricharina praecox]